MAQHVKTAHAYHTNGAAKALADVVTAGDAVDTENADTLWVENILAGTAVVNFRWHLEQSHDGGTTYTDMPAQNGDAAAGVIDYDAQVMEAPVASCWFGPIKVAPGTKIRQQALKVGGDGTSTLLSHFVLSATAPAGC